jgi:hypothetical protein
MFRHRPIGPRPHCWGFEITLRHTTLGRIPLDEWSAWRRDPYLTTHNIHKRQAPMLRRGLNPHCQQASGRKSSPDNVRQLINMTLLPLPRDRKVSHFLLKTWQHLERLVKDNVISLCHVTGYVVICEAASTVPCERNGCWLRNRDIRTFPVPCSRKFYLILMRTSEHFRAMWRTRLSHFVVKICYYFRCHAENKGILMTLGKD